MWPARSPTAGPCHGPGRPGPTSTRAMARLAQPNRTPEGAVWRPRTAAAGGRPQAGLEVVEKVLTTSVSGPLILNGDWTARPGEPVPGFDVPRGRRLHPPCGHPH